MESFDENFTQGEEEDKKDNVEASCSSSNNVNKNECELASFIEQDHNYCVNSEAVSHFICKSCGTSFNSFRSYENHKEMSCKELVNKKKKNELSHWTTYESRVLFTAIEKYQSQFFDRNLPESELKNLWTKIVAHLTKAGIQKRLHDVKQQWTRMRLDAHNKITVGEDLTELDENIIELLSSVEGFEFMIMELKRKESLRRLMLHHYQNGKNSVETATAICESLGKDAITQRTVSRWFQRFKEGDFKLSDHDRCDKETININQLKSLLEKGTAPQQIAKEMGVPRKTILEYITKMKSKKVKNNKADNKQQQINNNSEEGNKNEEVTDSVAEENEVIKPIEVCNIKMEMPYEFETENGVEDSIQPHVIIKEEPHLVNQENVQYPAPQFVTVPMNNVVQEEEEQQQQQPLLKVLRSETVKDIRQVKHDLLNKQTFLTTPMLIRKRGRKRKLSNESGVKTKIIINNENNSNEVDPLRGDLKLTKNISAATNDGLSSNDNSVSTKQRRKSEEKSKSKQEKIIPTKQKSLLKLKPLNKVSTSSNNVLEHNSLLSCFEHTALQNPSITIIPLYVNGQNEPVKEPDTVISNKDINVVNVKNDKNKNCDNQEDKDKNKEKKKEIGKSHRVAMTEYEFKMYNLYKKKVEIAMQHEKERHEKAMKMYQLLLDKIESSKFNIKQILDADCEF